MAGMMGYMMLAKDIGLEVEVVRDVWRSCGLPDVGRSGMEAPVLDELERRGLYKRPAKTRRGRPRAEAPEGMSGIKVVKSISLDAANIMYAVKASMEMPEAPAGGNISWYIDNLIYADRKARGDMHNKSEEAKA